MGMCLDRAGEPALVCDMGNRYCLLVANVGSFPSVVMTPTWLCYSYFVSSLMLVSFSFYLNFLCPSCGIPGTEYFKSKLWWYITFLGWGELRHRDGKVKRLKNLIQYASFVPGMTWMSILILRQPCEVSRITSFCLMRKLNQGVFMYHDQSHLAR